MAHRIEKAKKRKNETDAENEKLSKRLFQFLQPSTSNSTDETEASQHDVLSEFLVQDDTNETLPGISPSQTEVPTDITNI